MKENWKLIFDGRNQTCDNIINAILKHRGIKNKKDFLTPSVKYLIPFEAFHNIEKAYSIIKETIDSGKKFIVYGDVDTDGCTAAAIAYRYLKNFTNNIYFYINEGKAHGVTESFDRDADTIIIVDSINNDTTEYKRLLANGSKIIVMDHHIPSEEVLAMKDEICLISSAIDNYPNPALSGAGVVWKVMSYIDTRMNTNYAYDLVDLATVGIIADMCDLSENSMENRYICYMGMSHVVNPAINYIRGHYDYNSKSVSFSIAPLVNCANRLENNTESLLLFIKDNLGEIKTIVDNLKHYKDCQDIQVSDIYNNIVKPQVEAQKDNKCFFFEIDGDRNFTGLIANKCVGEYKKPTIIYNKTVVSEKEVYTGSMRAVGVESFLKIVNDTGLATCMGHENAAGFICEVSNFEQFKIALEEALKDVVFDYTTEVDVRLSPEQLSPYLVNNLKTLNRLTGLGFKEVNVLISDITGFTITSMTDRTHMKLQSGSLSCIKWKIPDWGEVYPDGSFSGIGTLDLDKYNVGGGVQLILNDFVFENHGKNSMSYMRG